MDPIYRASLLQTRIMNMNDRKFKFCLIKKLTCFVSYGVLGCLAINIVNLLQHLLGIC